MCRESAAPALHVPPRPNDGRGSRAKTLHCPNDRRRRTAGTTWSSAEHSPRMVTRFLQLSPCPQSPLRRSHRTTRTATAESPPSSPKRQRCCSTWSSSGSAELQSWKTVYLSLTSPTTTLHPSARRATASGAARLNTPLHATSESHSTSQPASAHGTRVAAQRNAAFSFNRCKRQRLRKGGGGCLAPTRTFGLCSCGLGPYPQHLQWPPVRPCVLSPSSREPAPSLSTAAAPFESVRHTPFPTPSSPRPPAAAVARPVFTRLNHTGKRPRRHLDERLAARAPSPRSARPAAIRRHRHRHHRHFHQRRLRQRPSPKPHAPRSASVWRPGAQHRPCWAPCGVRRALLASQQGSESREAV